MLNLMKIFSTVVQLEKDLKEEHGVTVTFQLEFLGAERNQLLFDVYYSIGNGKVKKGQNFVKVSFQKSDALAGDHTVLEERLIKELKKLVGA